MARLEEANLHIHSNSTNIHEGVECKYALLTALFNLSLLSKTHGRTVSQQESEVQGLLTSLVEIKATWYFQRH